MTDPKSADPAEPGSASLLSAGEARDFLDASPDLFCMIDPTTAEFVWLNPHWEEVLGTPQEEMIGQTFISFLHPDDVERWTQEASKIKAGGRAVLFENRYRRADGDYRWLSWNARLSADGSRFVCSARDITQSRTTTAELHRVSAQLQSVLDAIPSGIITIDASGTVGLYNDAAQRLFGYTASQVVGQNVSLLMPEPVRSQHAGYLARYAETGEARIIGRGREVVARRSDGTEVPVDVAVVPTRIDGRTVFIGSLTNATERKRWQAELTARNREVERTAAYDRTIAAVLGVLQGPEPTADKLRRVLGLLADRHGFRPAALYQHDSWENMLMLSATCSISDPLPDSVRLGQGVLGAAAQTREVVEVQAEEAGIALNLDTGIGVVRPASIIALPLLHQDSLHGVMVLASARPLEDPERAFLRRLADRLGMGLQNLRQIRDLTEMSRELELQGQEIVARNRDLAKASRLKSEFLARMSHELRTPLNAIIGFSELLKNRRVPDATRQVEYAEEIYGAGTHLLSLINDVLDLSKIEADKMTLEPEAVDIAQAVANAVSIVRQLAHEGDVDVTADVSSDIVEITVDRRALSQILYNLLSNAIKFTDRGGAVRVEVAAHGEGPDRVAVISVIDTGIGIAEEDMHRLFVPFEQLDGSLGREHQGTGLGLDLVRRLAMLHGGTVDVSSAPGEGSRFDVSLPFSPSPPGAAAPAPVAAVPAPSARPRARVLLVHAEAVERRRLLLALKAEGHEVTAVSTTRAAVDAAGQAPPDVIILDTEVDASDPVTALQSMTGEGPIPTILLCRRTEVPGFAALGAARFIPKPPGQDALLQALQGLGIAPDQDPPPRILVCDDEPRTVRLLRDLLRLAGVRVETCSRGAEALARIEQDPPDLLILDLMMPGMTGFDVLAELRSRPAARSLPVLVTTAKVLTADERELLAASAQAVAEKGTTSNASLLALVANAVSGRSA